MSDADQVVAIPAEESKPTPPLEPAGHAAGSPGLPRWAIAALAVGIVIAVLWPVAYGVYIAPRFDHDQKVTVPPDNDTAPPPFVPAAVNVTPSYLLTGTAASIWTVTFCSGGAAPPGSVWLCGVSLKVTNASMYYTYTVDEIQVNGATLASLTPSTPQNVAYGNSVSFAVGISVPSSGSTSISPTIVIDSR